VLDGDASVVGDMVAVVAGLGAGPGADIDRRHIAAIAGVVQVEVRQVDGSVPPPEVADAGVDGVGLWRAVERERGGEYVAAPDLHLLTGGVAEAPGGRQVDTPRPGGGDGDGGAIVGIPGIGSVKIRPVHDLAVWRHRSRAPALEVEAGDGEGDVDGEGVGRYDVPHGCEILGRHPYLDVARPQPVDGRISVTRRACGQHMVVVPADPALVWRMGCGIANWAGVPPGIREAEVRGLLSHDRRTAPESAQRDSRGRRGIAKAPERRCDVHHLQRPVPYLPHGHVRPCRHAFPPGASCLALLMVLLGGLGWVCVE